MAWWAAYLAAGASIGLLAGLLGIGGGMTLVPVLAWLFALHGVAEAKVVHLALGTATAFAFVTALASSREHLRAGAVQWPMVRALAPGMVAGSLLATAASGWIAQRHLALAYAAIVYAASVQLALGRKPQAARVLPGAWVLGAIGLAIGLVSGLVAAGGTFLALPVMLYFGVAMHQAIGSGAAIVVPVTFVGMLGYTFAGWGAGGLPAYTLGFVWLPAWAALAAGGVLTAPIGARLAHRLPVATLKRVFALLLAALATRMLVRYW